MKKIIVLIIVSIFTISAKSQPQYTGLVVSDKNIIGLTENGKIVFFDKERGEKVDTVAVPSKGVVLAKDRSGEIVVANEKNEIIKYEKDKKTWQRIANSKSQVFGVLFDSKNTCYLITATGIINTGTQKQYFSEAAFNYRKNKRHQWTKPYTYYIDKKDRIWMAFDYGEWGGCIFIFDTKKNEFLKPDIDQFFFTVLWPVKSFFETNKNIYLSAGLQHFFMKGLILKFDGLTPKKVYVSEFEYGDSDDKSFSGHNEYIGPATFNKYNNSIYYYSQEGIKKGNLKRDLSKKENWKLIIKPKLHWIYGQRDAVGSQMNILKLEILDKKRFVFLSQNDGIGLYNGRKLIMLK
ncbi:MAG: hypothetical protein GXO69_01545 [Acidobacteria bacterium]|nr:hypothetical protein [Acidobacteriota bacterium]